MKVFLWVSSLSIFQTGLDPIGQIDKAVDSEHFRTQREGIVFLASKISEHRPQNSAQRIPSRFHLGFQFFHTQFARHDSTLSRSNRFVIFIR